MVADAVPEKKAHVQGSSRKWDFRVPGDVVCFLVLSCESVNHEKRKGRQGSTPPDMSLAFGGMTERPRVP